MGTVFKALKKAGMATSSAEPVQQNEVNTAGEMCGTDSGAQQTTEAAQLPRQDRERVKRAFSLERSDWDERLILATAVDGPVAENIRSLRTQILHPRSGRRIRSVLVTSAGPGAGKSFVCANLAVSFAQGMDHQGLLVNCDLRKPSLEKMFGVANEQGLVDVLRDGKEVHSCILPVGIENLDILPTGRPPVNPAELLGSERMRMLLNELEKEDARRILLLDSPPVLSAAETAVLIQYVDAVVLVVRYGKSRREHVLSVVEQIGKNKIIGVVFNAYETSPLEEKLFGSYEEKYGYYYEEEKK